MDILSLTAQWLLLAASNELFFKLFWAERIQPGGYETSTVLTVFGFCLSFSSSKNGEVTRVRFQYVVVRFSLEVNPLQSFTVTFNLFAATFCLGYFNVVTDLFE